MLAGSASTMKEGEELSELEARALEGNILRNNYECFLPLFFCSLKIKYSTFFVFGVYMIYRRKKTLFFMYFSKCFFLHGNKTVFFIINGCFIPVS